MAAPKGNKFYQLREKSGRDRLFSSPEELMAAANEYFAWCVKNPCRKTVISVGRKFRVPTDRPFTMSGLCIHLGITESYFRDFKASLKGKGDQKSHDFSSVISYIEQIIYNQKFTGAAVGIFNANIISRDLGLIDKTSMDIDFNRLTDEQLDRLIEKIANTTHD